MEEERSNNNLCKICNKSFASGKAMGGHMRSHMVKHPLPLKPKYSLLHPKSPPPSSSSMNAYRSQNQRELISAVTDYHRPAAVMINGGDTGSDDSPRNSSHITRRRSKRRRRSTVESISNIVAVQSPEREGSSDSELCLVEEVAWTLVSLARGTWGTRMEDLVVHEDELDEEDEDDLLVVIQERPPRTPTSKRGSYRCETCKKCFRSYQALGGHRASHKKMKGIVIKDNVQEWESESESEEGSGSGGATAAAVGGYKCPFCDKVFESGQALGGHKKVHFAYLPVAAAPTPVRNSAKSGGELLDLNRPADELSDGEVSIATAIRAEKSYW